MNDERPHDLHEGLSIKKPFNQYLCWFKLTVYHKEYDMTFKPYCFLFTGLFIFNEMILTT